MLALRNNFFKSAIFAVFCGKFASGRWFSTPDLYVLKTHFSNFFAIFFFFLIVIQEILSYPLLNFFSLSLFHYISLIYFPNTASFLALDSPSPQSNSCSWDSPLNSKSESDLFTLLIQSQKPFLFSLSLLLLLRSWSSSIEGCSVFVDWVCSSFCLLKYSIDTDLVFFRYASYCLVGGIAMK